MISFETSARVKRPIEEVFAFVSDPLLFPRWNSAVQTVHSTSGGPGELASRYSMQREIPTGRVENALEVFAYEHPIEFGIRTISGPTPFVYQYRFASEGRSTVIDLSARVELPGVAGALGPLAARAVRRGVDANFVSLKQLLEETDVASASASQ